VARAAAALGLLCWASEAAAHGFGQRFDLPLPLWLWVAGAGATIVLTFIVMAVFVVEKSLSADYPRVNLLRYAPVRWLAHPAVVALLRFLAVAVFLLTVLAGFLGVQNPYSNLIPTMVWVVWWVGFAFACALLGDLWALLNPLRTLFGWSEVAYGALTRGRLLSRHYSYPAWLGCWPAVMLFLGFAWAELVWRDNDIPAYLACATLGYSIVTWIGMFLYGQEAWLRNGEAFSVVFGILARFAPVDERLELRAPGTGLITDKPVPWSFLAFVLLMLATVTFDGFLETPLMQRFDGALHRSRTVASLLFELSERGFDESQVIASAALAAFPLGFFAAYWLASWAMVRLTARGLSVDEAARSFVLTLVPIAVAYHLSHYFSLLLTAGQFVIPLASDPFGYGWDLFGTARYKVDLGILSPFLLWYGAVTLIVIGHVIAVYVAHRVALRVFGGRRDALASQIPLVGLMVAYTTLSLWILAQPIVA
jgi:hypothetical protein